MKAGLNMILKLYLPGKMRLSLSKINPKGAAGNEIHYIGGSEVLPPPLEGEEENNAINGLETEYANEARALLIEHNLRLVVYIAKKFDNTGVGVEDLISIGTIGLIKAINTFNRSKNIKLATYASRCIENEILMHLRTNKKTALDVSLNEVLGVDKDGGEMTLLDILPSEQKEIIDQIETSNQILKLYDYFQLLSPREQEILIDRYGLNNHKEKTQKEIAKELNISRSYVSRIEKRALVKLFKAYLNDK